MSAGVQQSMFFLGLPDLKKLVCVTVTLPEDDQDLRSKQIKTCRELVLLYSDVLASPALDSFTEISVVMAIPFLQKGVLQVFGQRRRLQLGSPQCVFPGVLQCCLSYSLITRLAPSWNKAGLYLVSGKDFLTEAGRLNAVGMELSTSEGQLCISIEANTVRLPPTTLEDFDLPPSVLRRFCSDPDFILDPASTGGAIWCHVLPSMKKGQIITISRQLPRDGPFRTYRDLQNHWNCLYGYRLPELAEEEEVYCSVYFRLVGQRLFTYPLSCVRLQPVQRCPRAGLQGALGPFLSDVRDRLQAVCGFPAHLTSKPRYHTASLNTAATVQVLRAQQINLTSSIRPVLTQLPPPPPPPPVKPSFGSQPPAWAPVSQQDGAQGRASFTFSAPSLTSSSSLPPFQPASALSSSSSSSSSLLPPLPPLSQTPASKLVPIFKNKCPSRHVNVAVLRLQRQRGQLSGGGEEQGRVTLPPFTTKTPTAASSSSCVSSSSAARLSIRPLPIVPRFRRRPKPPSGAAPPPTGHPKLKRIPSLSPPAQGKPGLIPPPKLQVRFRADATLGSEVGGEAAEQPSAEPPRPLASSDDHTNSSRQGVLFKSKPKKSRSVVRDVDVEKMARSNQLSKLNSATLSAWLRGRGALVGAKHKKEELMLKVMGCLAEA
ncbi:uncharacterized protein C18orf63 homolog [Pempheris klunzingeri]|uniref:uncharacterized protein C18orf63 homolog n=1 Tax=Pempheris klunzingeri TaxID=3127111 RepID=UPI0039807A51